MLIFFFYFIIEEQLIYSVVLVSSVQKSDSVTYIYIYIYIYTHTHTHTFFFKNIIFHYGLSRILNIVPCAIQQDLVFYPFSIEKLTSANPNLPLLFCNKVASTDGITHIHTHTHTHTQNIMFRRSLKRGNKLRIVVLCHESPD